MEKRLFRDGLKGRGCLGAMQTAVEERRELMLERKFVSKGDLASAFEEVTRIPYIDRSPVHRLLEDCQLLTMNACHHGMREFTFMGAIQATPEQSLLMARRRKITE